MGQGQEPRDQPAGRQPQGGQPPMQPNAGGATPGIGGGAAQPTLPPAESLAKDFWGHLPELPRQRMMQFYREQYMSRYKDLLPQYYSSLAEKEKKAKK